MSTNLGQRLIDRGIEQGIEQGIERTLLRVLTNRFGAVPIAVSTAIARIDDVQRLEQLVDVALTAGSIEEFTRSME